MVLPDGEHPRFSGSRGFRGDKKISGQYLLPNAPIKYLHPGWMKKLVSRNFAPALDFLQVKRRCLLLFFLMSC